jgi:precorrin-6B methylase 2
MTYSKSVKDNNQKEIGSGSGSIKIEITKVGQVTVTPPK